MYSLPRFNPFLFLFLHPRFVYSFNFSFSAPSQCDNLSISWQGGIEPFSLFISPLFSVALNVTLPNLSYNSENQTGFYELPLSFPSGQQIVLVMSDKMGFGTGGISNLLTVGPSQHDSNCNTTSPAPNFVYELNTALQQCRTYTFSSYTGAVQPVTILGMIPLGDPFILHPPVGPTSYNWIANVPEGTSVTFAMVDAHGRNGGSSDLKLVGDTNDSSCISNSSPTSTVNGDHSSTSSPSPSQLSSALRSSSGLSSGAIAGIVIGIILGLLAVALIFWFWRYRKPESKGSLIPGPEPDRADSHRRHLSLFRRARQVRPVDLLHGHAMSYASSSLSLPRIGFPKSPVPEISPYLLSSADAASDRLGPSSISERANISHFDDEEVVPQVPPDFTQTSPSGLQSGRRSSVSTSRVSEKTGTLISSRSPSTLPRLIVHNDAEDIERDVDGSYIELPPVYSESRSSQSPPDH